MLKPVGKLFLERGKSGFDETDRKRFVEQYLRDRLRTAAVFCEVAEQERVVVRAPAALVRQEVYMAKHELAEALKNELGLELKKLVVTQL